MHFTGVPRELRSRNHQEICCKQRNGEQARPFVGILQSEGKKMVKRKLSSGEEQQYWK